LKKVDDSTFVGWSEHNKTEEKKDNIVVVFNGWDLDFVTDKVLSTVMTILVIEQQVLSTVALIANRSTP
jgi:hypothetical protein